MKFGVFPITFNGDMKDSLKCCVTMPNRWSEIIYCYVS